MTAAKVDGWPGSPNTTAASRARADVPPTMEAHRAPRSTALTITMAVRPRKATESRGNRAWATATTAMSDTVTPNHAAFGGMGRRRWTTNSPSETGR